MFLKTGFVCSDVPGEQQSRDHGVRVHDGPGIPAHDIHAGVDAVFVAARQDDRLLVKERKTTVGNGGRSFSEAETSFGCIFFFFFCDELYI